MHKFNLLFHYPYLGRDTYTACITVKHSPSSAVVKKIPHCMEPNSSSPPSQEPIQANMQKKCVAWTGGKCNS